MGVSMWKTLSKIGHVQTSTLKNGLVVATSRFGKLTATIGVWINSGSRWESEENNGTAHFLEHMAFRGTKTRSQHDIESQIENIGGHLNAYTSREHTCYYSKVQSQHIPLAVDVLADILLNSRLDKRAIEEERHVILREHEEVGKNIEELVMDNLHLVTFPNLPLGYPILGSPHTISAIQRSHLTKYIQDHYVGPNMILVGTGDVDHRVLKNLAMTRFASLPRKSIPPPVPGTFSSGDIRIKKNIGNIHFSIAFKGPAFQAKNYFPMLVAQTILGSWGKSSPAYSPFSESMDRSRVNSFMAFNTCYSDIGLWGIHVVVQPTNHLDHVVSSIFTELRRISTCPTPVELEHAKTQIKSTILFGMDDTSSIADDLGRQILLSKKPQSIYSLFSQIDAVDLSAVKHAMARCLETIPALSAVGSLEYLPSSDRIKTMWSKSRIP